MSLGVKHLTGTAVAAVTVALLTCVLVAGCSMTSPVCASAGEDSACIEVQTSAEDSAAGSSAADVTVSSPSGPDIASVKTTKVLGYGSRFIVGWKVKAASGKVSGYRIRYSATKDMADAKVKKVAGSKKTAAVIKISQNRKPVYYAQVQAYFEKNGKVYRGAWSTLHKVVLGTPLQLKKAAKVKNYIRKSLAHGKKTAKYQKYIVLHDTEGNGSPKSFADYFSSTGTYVAAHFVVSRNGEVGQIVDMDQIAHHAGYGNKGHDKKYGVKSDGRDDMRGTKSIGSSCPDYGMNSFSIGIEMEHIHGQNYTKAQLKSLDRLIAYIDAYYGFESKIIDHKAWRAGNSDTDSTFKTYLANYKRYRTHAKPKL